MLPRHAVVTLTGKTQGLGDAGVLPEGLAELPIVEAWFRPYDQTGHAIYVGAVKDGPVTATNYGQHLDVDSQGTFLGFRLGPLSAGSFKLKDMQVFGTAEDKLTILCLAW